MRPKATRMFLSQGDFYPSNDVICTVCGKHWRYFGRDKERFYLDDDNRIALRHTLAAQGYEHYSAEKGNNINTVWMCCRRPFASVVTIDKRPDEIFTKFCVTE